MSLKAKILLSTSLFMVLVVSLLTLNLSIDAISRQGRERDTQARLIQRLVVDWVREGTGPADWDELSRRLVGSSLITDWVLVEDRGGVLQVLSYSEGTTLPLSSETVSRLQQSIGNREVESFGSWVYMSVETRFGKVYGARFRLAPDLEEEGGVADSLTRIFTIMALGTALLLLNVFIFLNRFVLRPLRELSDASKRVSEGDFSRKIPEMGAMDEMGHLRHAFNTMTEKVATSRRGLEEEIREARDRIQKTERRLFQAQRLSTTGTLAAGIAHEINNPLGGLMNAAHAIRSGTLPPEKEKEYQALIEEGLERIHGIVQKVLQFRPKEVEARPVDLREVADRSLAFCEHRMKQKCVSGNNLLEKELPLVKGDPLELQQVFLNILMNAVDACSEKDGRVEISGRVCDDYVKVTFSDNGKGMDEAELSRCMDIFYTTKEVGEGSGLGLSVAHKIIENHGGRLDLDSGLEKGTSVHVLLPFLSESIMGS